MLKTIRLLSALFFFTLITFYFLDFAGFLPHSFHGLAHIQFVPALLSLSVGILVVLLLLTLLLGRIYCSIICPLGVFQDVVSRCSRILLRKKRTYTFSKPKTVLRYSVLTGVAVTFFCGLTSVLALLDPYSAYGRIVVNIFRPVYLMGNNLLETIFVRFNNYTFYKMDAELMSFSSFLIALITFLIISILAWQYGRTWCNTVCPVGTVLGVVSKYSLFKIQIREDRCTHCTKCARVCKASCIDSKKEKVDHSRCVTCFNCLHTCKQKALFYSFSGWSPKKTTMSEKTLPADPETRRQFLTVTAAATTAALTPKLFAKDTLDQAIASSHGVKAYTRAHPITPPGSISQAHFNKHCTACHLCVSKCPTRILKPAWKEYGWGGIMQPIVDFQKGFCNFDCTICSQICPNQALVPLTKEEKHLTQIGFVVLIEENCIVYRDGTSCGACSEHCPTQAISMVPWEDGLTVPQIDTDICVGCGGCEYVCPAQPFRAVYVEGNTVHKAALPFAESDRQEIEIEGFGF